MPVDNFSVFYILKDEDKNVTLIQLGMECMEEGILKGS